MTVGAEAIPCPSTSAREALSKALQNDANAAAEQGMRIPAREIEAAVAERVAEALDDPLSLLAVGGFTLHSAEARQTMALAETLAEQVRGKDYAMVRSLVSRVQANPREVWIELDAGALARALNVELSDDIERSIPLTAQVRLTRTGRAVRLVHSNGKAATAGTPDAGLINLLLTARQWWARLATGEIDIATLSKEEGVNDSWMSRVIRMNFLAPSIVEAILDGTQPVTLTAAWLRRDDLPLEWERQWEALAG